MELPPCCASCTELDAALKRCRLLSRPTLDARHRLLTMPCSVTRLVRQRFRGHQPEASQRALLAWVNPAWSPDAIVQSYGDAPQDARLWLTSWPSRELGRVDVTETHGDEPRSFASDAPGAPAVAPGLRDATLGALAHLSGIDPVGTVMVIEVLRGTHDPARWRAAIGANDQRNEDHLVLALFRYLCLTFGVLERLAPEEAIAVRVRRFSLGELSDAGALATTRGAFARADLPMSEFRRLYAAGVDAALRGLERALDGGGAMTEAFRRVLRVADRPQADAETGGGGGDVARCLSALAPHLDAARAALSTLSGAHHLGAASIAALSDAAVSSAVRGAIVDHLVACEDGRCNTLARWEVGGVQAVRMDLAGPLSDPPPGWTYEAQGQVSPRLIQCRDVLWDAFARMARAEKRSVDDLVNDAMARYRMLREYVGEDGSEPGPEPHPRRPVTPSPAFDETAPRRPADLHAVALPPGEAPPSLSPATIRARASDFDEDDITKSEGYRKLGPRTGALARSIAFDLPPRSLPKEGDSRDPVVPASHRADEAAASEARPESAVGPSPGEEIPFDLAHKSPANRDTPLLGVAYALGDLVPDAEAPKGNRPDALVPQTMAESFAQLDEEVGGIQRESTSPKMFATPLQPPLFLEYLGRKYHVSHPRFVIGREKGSCHLLIADANVSRQHAVVEWNAGNYYMVDQGSTNGVGSGGHRIHRKQIVEGDRFEISGHVLTFTFRLQP